MINRPVRAKTACEAVGLDRDRFNEEVHAGTYPCAPATDPGKVRLFHDPDLIGLYVYAFLRQRLAVPGPQAGPVACGVVDQARQLLNARKPLSGDVVIGYDHAGVRFVDLGEDTNPTVDGTRNGYSGTFSPMVCVIRVPLSNILQIVRNRVEELLLPLGED